MERNQKVENFINWCNEMWENMTEEEKKEAEEMDDDIELSEKDAQKITCFLKAVMD